MASRIHHQGPYPRLVSLAWLSCVSPGKGLRPPTRSRKWSITDTFCAYTLSRQLTGKAFGKFGHYSGLTFEYSEKKEVGSRVSDVVVNATPLDPEKMYSIATTEFLANGGDGKLLLILLISRIFQPGTWPMACDRGRSRRTERRAPVVVSPKSFIRMSY
jgi:hypothetical protein